MLTGSNAVKVYYDKYLLDHLQRSLETVLCVFAEIHFRVKSSWGHQFIFLKLSPSQFVEVFLFIYHKYLSFCFLVGLWEFFFRLWAHKNQEGVIFKRSHKQKNSVPQLQRVLSSWQDQRLQTRNRSMQIWRRRARYCWVTAQRMIQKGKNGRKIQADGQRRVELDRRELEQRDKSDGTRGNEEGRLDWMPLFKFYVRSFQAMWTLLVESVRERWLKLKSYG